METNKLIKNALDRLCSEWKKSDPKRAVYALAALEQIDTFDSLCQRKDWSTGVEDVFQMATRPPELLREKDHEGYAHFVYGLMKDGPFYGMAHEDPLGANVLVGSALSLFRKFVVEEDQRTLLPKALDLMLLQSVAYMQAGARDLARMQLMSIVDLTTDVQNGDSDQILQMARSEAEKLTQDIVLRAAPAALMLSSIFRYESDEKRAEAASALSQRLFQEVLEQKEPFPGSRNEKLMAMLSCSELSLHQGEKVEALDMLDRVVLLTDTDAALLEEGSAIYQYVVSVANQRRAHIYMVQEEWESAQHHYNAALELAKRAHEEVGINVHFHDHYAALLNEVGICYGVQGDLLGAQDKFLQAIEERKDLVDKSDHYTEQLVAYLNNMATLMRKHNKKEVAAVYLQDAIDVAQGTDADPDLLHDMQKVMDGIKEESTTFTPPSDGFGPN